MNIDTTKLCQSDRQEAANFLQGFSEITFVTHTVEGVWINTAHSSMGETLRLLVLKELEKYYDSVQEGEGDDLKVTIIKKHPKPTSFLERMFNKLRMKL